MGPPRRNHSGSGASAHNSPRAQRARQQRAQPSIQAFTPEPSESPSIGMSALSRYNHNLKVLRRRDPSIVSIFDQFSHVCVYHHNGSKWEKQGFEGTMFLYERDSYPPYGFYILNRVGMEDYIQRLYPEDSMQAHESYLMMRSYPTFTSRRLALAHASLPPQRAEGPASKFAREFAISDPEKLLDGDKGASQTVSLWCFATDARDPMQDVMIRLHSYIKKNLPYPDEFRYAPDRPPPVNLATNGIHEAPTPSTSQPPINGSSSLDALFSKLQPPTESASANDLFMGSQDLSRANTESPTQNRGLALLNTIFASASSPALSHATAPKTVSSTSSFHERPIFSPKPTPQILTPDVISALLGLTPSASPAPASPSSSTALSSSSSQRSGQYPSRYEGDNEDEASDGSDGGFSASVSSTSTALDLDVDNNLELRAAGASAGVPLLAVHGQSNGFGDSTPRPPRGMDLEDDLKDEIRTSTPPPPEFSPARGRKQTQNQHQPPASTSHSRLQVLAASSSFSPNEDLTPGLVKSSSSSTIKADFNNTSSKRSLVPFSADSELWPYPRAPVDDRSHSTDNDGVVELDFADTSALSDPNMFQEKEKAGKNAKTKGKKKGKKERAEERVKERDEIEKSWDVPAPVTPVPAVVNGKGKTPVKASSLPLANGSKSPVDQDMTRASIISTLSFHNVNPAGMSRNEFVREVLTLIHTDKDFVDKLWGEYTSRLG